MIPVLEINHVKWSLFKKRNNTGAWGSIYRLHSKYHDVHDTYWVYVYIEIQAPVRKKFPLYSFIMTCLFTRTMKIQWRIILKRRKRGRRKKGTCIIWSPRTFSMQIDYSIYSYFDMRIAYMDQMIFWSKFFIVCSHIVINFLFFLSSSKESLD